MGSIVWSLIKIAVSIAVCGKDSCAWRIYAIFLVCITIYDSYKVQFYSLDEQSIILMSYKFSLMWHIS